MARFIDFRELRSQLDFAQVLALYKVQNASVRDQQLTAICPFPTHLGVRLKPSFSADLARGIWQCFGCKTSGNVLDFAVRMEGHNPKDGAAVREVALKLQMRFLTEHAPAPSPSPGPIDETESPESVVVNAPLDFVLKGLDPTHESLASLAIDQETIAHFGLGYCSRGFLKGRIAIPLHDSGGMLIGYAGRSCAPHAQPSEPLYLFPSERHRNGAVHRFSPEHLVYGAHAIGSSPLQKKLIVADDFSLVWRLWELAVPAVSIPSHRLTSAQEEILRHLAEPSGIVFVSRSPHELSR